MHSFSTPLSISHLLSFLLIYLLTLTAAAPANSTLLARQEPDSDDTLARTMCFCTNSNRFTQLARDPPAFAPDFVSHSTHRIGLVYKFEYYNKRIDHHFALHALDTCTTHGYIPNPCLDIAAQDRRWAHTFYTATVPPNVKKHAWEFVYHFTGDDSMPRPDGGKRDYFTFHKDRRELPRRRAWMADRAEVRTRCTEVCAAKWGMEYFEDGLYGRDLSRIELFRVGFDFDDICYWREEQEGKRCVART
ncbi:MAG: hypothetical protein Q9173_001986 [Seirophora scorigena]